MSLPELDPPLPWSRWPLAWLLGGRCRQRLSRLDSRYRYGRCELVPNHRGEDHALDYGMDVLRFDDDGRTWTSADRAGQSPADR